MHSALYFGQLEHRRRQPRWHAFSYRLFMVYLDLSELDQVFRGRWLWSATRIALARFRRRDHLGDPGLPLEEAVRALVHERTGVRPAGPIRLLTHLRYFGYGFNPVSFYYCFDAGGQALQAVVAEVNNTPWGERHCYVLPQAEPGARRLRARSDKAMHVSPFNPMALEYRWAFSPPGARLAVHMSLHEAPAGVVPVFDATLALRRRPITGAALALALLRFPLMTVQVIAAIHWQALRLWLARVPVHEHPSKRSSTAPTVPARPESP